MDSLSLRPFSSVIHLAELQKGRKEGNREQGKKEGGKEGGRKEEREGGREGRRMLEECNLG